MITDREKKNGERITVVSADLSPDIVLIKIKQICLLR